MPDSLLGRRVIVTGASAGIGLEVARQLASRGATVVAGCRDVAKCSAVLGALQSVTVRQLDLTNRKSIEAFARAEVDTHQPISVLINNAGTLETKYDEVDGIERTLLTNHLGPWYLTQLLLPNLVQANTAGVDSRVVFVSSRLEKNGRLDYQQPFLRLIKNGYDGKEDFDGWRQYANSKQMNLSAANELSRRQPGLTINSVTPGMVHTSLSRNYSPWLLWATFPLRYWMLRSPETGARAVVHAAVDAPRGVSGQFLGDDGKVLAQSRQGAGADEAESYKRTEEMLEYWRRRLVL